MEPWDVECELPLALQWPRLLKAHGLSVEVAPDGLSGTVLGAGGHRVPISFARHTLAPHFAATGDYEEEIARLRRTYYCCVTDIRDAEVGRLLGTALLASGGYGSFEGYLIDPMVRFGGPSGPDEWNLASAGVAAYRVEGVLCHPGGPELPFGSVSGGPVPARFATGPACSDPERPLHTYLELDLCDGWDWRKPAARRFIQDAVARLEACGGSAFWGIHGGIGG